MTHIEGYTHPTPFYYDEPNLEPSITYDWPVWLWSTLHTISNFFNEISNSLMNLF